MANPGQPTLSPGATGSSVRRLQRALRRTLAFTVTVNGKFDTATKDAVKDFQNSEAIPVDGIVGPQTWAALPDGGPMPLLEKGSRGEVVKRLQEVLTNGAPVAWNTTPQGIDDDFGNRANHVHLSGKHWAAIRKPADWWARFILPQVTKQSPLCASV